MTSRADSDRNHRADPVLQVFALALSKSFSQDVADAKYKPIGIRRLYQVVTFWTLARSCCERALIGEREKGLFTGGLAGDLYLRALVADEEEEGDEGRGSK